AAGGKGSPPADAVTDVEPVATGPGAGVTDVESGDRPSVTGVEPAATGRGAGVTDVESESAAARAADVTGVVHAAAPGDLGPATGRADTAQLPHPAGAEPPPGFVSETASTPYQHDDPRAEDRRWIVACEEARAA
ncbi:MAG: hypothetical protein L6Q95_14435, partial [Planctomycetes bacterium]|nr:hypothetical protein [Planctomycetota bacterium]